jgi:hypothetical protein
LQREFSLYLNGELTQSDVKRIENHLLDCGSCRTTLFRLRNGHRLAQQLPRFTPRIDPWAALEATIDAATITSSVSSKPSRRLVWDRRAAYGSVAVFALIALLVIGYGTRLREDENSLVAEALDLSQFQLVNIADIEQNQNPHVVTEGYVSEMMPDDEGDLKFRLVADLGRPGPFVVCEILDPIKLKVPPVGSRVRVYGVSRYDGQADRNWYEVHPVLNIEVVKH